MAVSSIGNSINSYASKSTGTQTTSGSGDLTMDGFMKLMAVQLQNQDLTSPMNNSEMMNQLTQMATVKAMNTFTDLATTQYSMSMIGQNVKLFTIDAKGNKVYIYGKVSGVDLAGNQIYLENDTSGTSYGIGNIMEVGTIPKKEETEDDDKEDEKVEPEDEIPETKPDTDESENVSDNKSGLEEKLSTVSSVSAGAVEKTGTSSYKANGPAL